MTAAVPPADVRAAGPAPTFWPTSLTHATFRAASDARLAGDLERLALERAVMTAIAEVFGSEPIVEYFADVLMPRLGYGGRRRVRSLARLSLMRLFPHTQWLDIASLETKGHA